MDYIELFAGIGGFRVGLEADMQPRQLRQRYCVRPVGDKSDPEVTERREGKEIGFNCIFASEWDKYARAVYRYHFGDIDGRDITTVPIGDIPDCDLIVGGPPCQDFSVAGGRAGIEGDRGNLMFTTIEIIQGKRPRYFLLENVPGLLSSGGGRDFANIIDALWQGGDYCVQWVVLNSKNFGVPQNRERVFIVGSARGEPRPEILPVGDGDGEVCEKGYGEDIAGCLGVKNESGQCNFDGSTTMISYKTNFAGKRVMQDCAGVLRADNIQEQWVGGIRRLTPLETERLQGFPDNWTAKGIDDEGGEVEISDTQRYKMTGNAVTTNVIRHFANVTRDLNGIGW